MKILMASAFAIAGLCSLAVALDGKPINKTCPIMKGKAVNPSITVEYQGQTIGLCCNKCKKQWPSNADEFIKSVPEFKPAAPAADEKAEIGKKVADFTLSDTDGANVSLSDLKGKIVVLQWINPRCPVCVRVSEKGLVTKMIDDLKAVSKDLAYFPVCSADKAESKAIAKYLEEHKVGAKGLMDGNGKVGKMFGAKTTPHVFVIDAEGVLRYAGAFDDDSEGKHDSAKNYALNAVKQIVEGKKVDPATTTPYGCGIKFSKASN